MKKFIKENWFKVALLLLIVIGACTYYFSYFLPNQNKLELLGLQEKCATQAQKFFTTGDLYKNGDGFTYDYTDHFNSKLNKCFILVSASNRTDGDFLELELYDALEIRHYASYIGHGVCDTLALSITGQPDKCWIDSGNVWLNGNDSNSADIHVGYGGVKGGSGGENTEKEFMSDIQPFMNN